MSRPLNPVQFETTKPKSIGEQAKANINKDYYMKDKYGVEINDYKIDLGEFKEAEEYFLEKQFLMNAT